MVDSERIEKTHTERMSKMDAMAQRVKDRMNDATNVLGATSAQMAATRIALVGECSDTSELFSKLSERGYVPRHAHPKELHDTDFALLILGDVPDHEIEEVIAGVNGNAHKVMLLPGTDEQLSAAFPDAVRPIDLGAAIAMIQHLDS
jgi:hypothetical protein